MGFVSYDKLVISFLREIGRQILEWVGEGVHLELEM
jgi:hypothetical protein